MQCIGNDLVARPVWKAEGKRGISFSNTYLLDFRFE